MTDAKVPAKTQIAEPQINPAIYIKAVQPAEPEGAPAPADVQSLVEALTRREILGEAGIKAVVLAEGEPRPDNAMLYGGTPDLASAITLGRQYEKEHQKYDQLQRQYNQLLYLPVPLLIIGDVLLFICLTLFFPGYEQTDFLVFVGLLGASLIMGLLMYFLLNLWLVFNTPVAAAAPNSTAPVEARAV